MSPCNARVQVRDSETREALVGLKRCIDANEARILALEIEPEPIVAGESPQELVFFALGQQDDF